MKSIILKIILLLSLMTSAYLPLGITQEASTRAYLEQEFSKAKAYLISFKNDLALVHLNPLVDTLRQLDQLNTPFGIRVQFRQAEALEKDQKDDIALENLLRIKALSATHEVWDAYANSSIILARLYEKIGRGETCYEYLNQARHAIQNNSGLDSLYPLFSIRLSSYHRIYSNADSALFYAKEVLRTAPSYKQLDKRAVGHMLMGMLSRDPAIDAKLKHYQAAAKIFKQIEDHAGYGYMVGSVSGWYFNHGDYDKALLYNDSTILSASMSIKEGFERHRTLWNAYKFRAHIYKTIDQMDSAWYYLQKGQQMELNSIHEINNEKVLEIDARYEDEKKEQKIAEQKNQIKFEKERRNLLLVIVCLAFIFASIVSYYYWRLRRANQKTKAQALTIQQKNEGLSNSLQQQIILQSEVHHRVKNNLQIIISLLDLQKEEIKDPIAQKNLEAMASRIYSMAAIHEILYSQEDMAMVNIHDYIENLCLHFSNFSQVKNKPFFDIQVEEQFLNLETSMPVGIILTELITNSLKYAREEGKKLKIFIALEKRINQYCFTYKDNGPGFKDGKLTERTGGLGTYLLTSMCRQLNGSFNSRNENGVCYEIFFKEKHNVYSYNILTNEKLQKK